MSSRWRCSLNTYSVSSPMPILPGPKSVLKRPYFSNMERRMPRFAPYPYSYTLTELESDRMIASPRSQCASTPFHLRSHHAGKRRSGCKRTLPLTRPFQLHKPIWSHSDVIVRQGNNFTLRFTDACIQGVRFPAPRLIEVAHI